NITTNITINNNTYDTKERKFRNVKEKLEIFKEIIRNMSSERTYINPINDTYKENKYNNRKDIISLRNNKYYKMNNNLLYKDDKQLHHQLHRNNQLYRNNQLGKYDVIKKKKNLKHGFKKMIGKLFKKKDNGNDNKRNIDETYEILKNNNIEFENIYESIDDRYIYRYNDIENGYDDIEYDLSGEDAEDEFYTTADFKRYYYNEGKIKEN
ncbi:hypothetical protein SLOPH_896, partial [Spraguea lophii 42_110]